MRDQTKNTPDKFIQPLIPRQAPDPDKKPEPKKKA